MPADSARAARRHDTWAVLLSDRNFDRRIRWSAELCDLTNDERCDHENPYEMLGSGMWADPDTIGESALCMTVPARRQPARHPRSTSSTDDSLHGLGGITTACRCGFGGEDADPSLDQYAAK